MKIFYFFKKIDYIISDSTGSSTQSAYSVLCWRATPARLPRNLPLRWQWDPLLFAVTKLPDDHQLSSRGEGKRRTFSFKWTAQRFPFRRIPAADLGLPNLSLQLSRIHRIDPSSSPVSSLPGLGSAFCRLNRLQLTGNCAIRSYE